MDDTSKKKDPDQTSVWVCSGISSDSLSLVSGVHECTSQNRLQKAPKQQEIHMWDCVNTSHRYDAEPAITGAVVTNV